MNTTPAGVGEGGAADESPTTMDTTLAAPTGHADIAAAETRSGFPWSQTTVASQTMAANEQALAWSMVEDTSPHQLSEPTRATAARGRPPSDLLTWALVIWLVVVIAFVAAVGVGVVMMWGVFPHAL